MSHAAKTYTPSLVKKHKPGGLHEMWSLSFPLMLSYISSYLTLFIDRCFLAYYSLDALNAAVNSSTLYWAFIGGANVMAAMAERNVAQSYGAGEKKHLGEPVWQMIWFSLFTALIFFPLGTWGTDLFYADKPTEAGYFRWMMSFAPLQPLSCALMTFFIGRGRIRWIVHLAVFTTLLNAILDYLLIFGVKGWIPEMGVKGAAIASTGGLFFQVTVLVIFFLRKHNRIACGTNQWRFNKEAFWKSCRVNLPPAVLYNMELIGWSVFYSMMTSAGYIHITVSSLCQSLILLFSFIGEGLCRGASILANNYLGAGKNKLLWQVFKSAGWILLSIFALQLIVFCINPEIFIRGLMPHQEEMVLLSRSLVLCLILVLFFLLMQSFQWVLAGLLYATGEGLFVMLSGVASMGIVLVLPVYLLVVHKAHSVEMAWTLVVMYSLCCTLIYLFRFKNRVAPLLQEI
jgi:MATE family multidrug resistance protein